MFPDNGIFLAVDAGTTNIKAALVEPGGQIVDLHSVPAAVLMTVPGRCEMDMEDVWRSVLACILALRERNQKRWPSVLAVGVCAQGDGAWLLDRQGTPLGNAILWNDTRVRRNFREINERCAALNTTPLFPGSAPVLLHWMKENDQDRYRRAAHVLHCKDWINYKLTGRICTDETDASTAVMNLFSKQYTPEILELSGIPEALPLFPEILPSACIIGTVSPAMADLLQFAPDVPVIAGAIDVLSVVTGCGLSSSGQCASIAGTTMGNIVVLEEQEAKKNLGSIGSVLCHTLPGLYVRQMSGLSGASALDWVRREILGEEPYPSIESHLAQIPVGSQGLLFHPYLYGERAPFALAGACGGFYGLRAHHTKYVMARAAFEGVALSMYDCYQSLPPCGNVMTLAGGAAKSDFLCGMISDCMGKTVLRRREKELGILGVCRMLETAFGLFTAPPTEEDSFLTHPEAHEQYRTLYTRFVGLREKMESVWSGTF